MAQHTPGPRLPRTRTINWRGYVLCPCIGEWVAYDSHLNFVAKAGTLKTLKGQIVPERKPTNTGQGKSAI